MSTMSRAAGAFLQRDVYVVIRQAGNDTCFAANGRRDGVRTQ